MKKVRVGVNGYGVIGKRVADAVRMQPDMELVGVSDIITDYRIKVAAKLDIPIYASRAEDETKMKDADIPVVGVLDKMIGAVNVMVDCTPKGIAAMNLEKYKTAGVKAIVQGGEKHSVTGHSFVAQANYATALGHDVTRVVSCNTTSIVRTLGALQDAKLLKKARGVLMRRATDPWESDRGGIMNTIVPEPHIPSHQGPDAQTVRPELDLVTIAAKASHTECHNHYWVVELTHSSSQEEVLDAFRKAPRIAFIRMSEGIVALNSTLELMRDLGRPRGDMWEVALWEDVLTVNGAECYYTYQVDNESIAIPENIDAIRALSGIVKDGQESIRMTDEALGIKRDFIDQKGISSFVQRVSSNSKLDLAAEQGGG
ncbi:MAG: type II glyceraldehyde-3-phosphate dehydrogenase [Candidatus Omnitrophica bacterium CG11_big_fil_rev_8_21_14_0_20_45_26]|uniref:Type II glyceraldehyde-3-phosphate dehydrogenase n=1 Tax=Candidatus Abzuiibacterium crystallinum TaxID=1974748 RepID=A0A2H0LNW7_9BACT|nr:MAG: type II glyceraldehyde-3-phosphate dehydrogenase [Candidatus Omnitrophica bacterium CG11_big_fil_rev_8_21_14_0_20_45_26]PIW65322.1 MAG: type II glyceraldehyde-3-phosphate dehydrogenase [Candidatus Omnitrophica bacterium CG12_big_fil_rev_8_21_14_0_65_45_16]